MSDTSIIREFLVALGFKVDEGGLKRFAHYVGEATKTVAELGASAVAAATAVEAATVKVSANFESLFYASQRLRSSVENIRAYRYALQQTGATADQAMGSMEGLAEFIRSNPGGEGFLRSLGVQTRDANGQLRGTVQIMGDLGKRFQAMPYYLAKVRANALGIDERTLQAMIRGTDEFADHYHKMAERVGVDQDAAAEAGHEFMLVWRDVLAYLQLSVEKVLLQLQGPGMVALERFMALAVRMFTALLHMVVRLVEWFGRLDKATRGMASAGLALLAVLGPLLLLLDPIAVAILAVAAAVALLVDDFQTWREGGKSLIDWSAWSDEIDSAMAGIADLWGAIKDFWDAFGPLAEGLAKLFLTAFGGGVRVSLDLLAAALHLVAGAIRVILDLLHGDFKKAWADNAEAGKKAMADLLRALKDSRNAAGKLLDVWNGKASPKDAAEGPSAKARENAIRQQQIAAAAAAAGRGGAVLAQQGADVRDKALAYFRSMGWSDASAAGLTANFQRESKLDPRAVGDNGAAYGIGQWHKDRQAAFAKWAGHDIRQSTLEEQLAFAHHELTAGAEKAAGAMIRGAKTAGEAGAMASAYYERPADRLGEMSRRAQLAEAVFREARLGVAGGRPVNDNGGMGANVTINQRTEIKVDGAGDASAAATRVAAAQDRVNGNLLRNTRGAVR